MKTFTHCRLFLLSLILLLAVSRAEAIQLPITLTSIAACDSDGIAIVELTGTGYTYYLYSYDANTFTPYQSIDTFYHLPAGGYEAIAFNSIDTSNVSFVIASRILLTDSVTAYACPSAPNGGIVTQVSRGTMPYSYLWSNGATTSSVSGLALGTYSVTVHDNAGCVASVTDHVLETVLQLNTVDYTQPDCTNNGSIVPTPYNGTAPYTYLWSNSSVADSLSGLAPGQYGVTVTDVQGCTGTYWYNLTQITNLYIGLQSMVPPTCSEADGIISVVTYGTYPPFTYLWSNGATSATITGLPLGNYDVTATDAHGCQSAPQYYAIQGVTDVQLDSTTYIQPNCSGGTGTIAVQPINGVAPYSYIWTTGDITDSISGLVPGQYTVTVIDAGGCRGITTYDLGAPLTVYWCTSTSPDCGDSNGVMAVCITGGSGAYAYVWSNGATGFTTSNLSAGVYSVTVTDLSGGCSVSASETLQGMSPYQITIVTTPTACDSSLYTGTATAFFTGAGTPPYSFFWGGILPDSLGGTSLFLGTTQTITGLPVGAFVSPSVVDSNGCIPQSMNIDSAVVQMDPSCYDHITGYMFIDSNSNCLYDSTERTLSALYVVARSSGGQIYYASTNAAGYYDIPVPPGIYTVFIDPYTAGGCSFSVCRSGYSDTFTMTGQVSLHNDFAVSIGAGYDLGVHMGYIGSAPGQPKEYWIFYYNFGAQSVPHGVVTFVHDTSLTLTATTPPYTSYNAATHTITWDIVNNLQPMGGLDQQHFITMTFDIPPTLALGTPLSAYASITPTSGDCDSSNNTQYIVDPVSASHDPNEKQVSPVGNLSAADTVLTYTIRFQNTGNAPANTIVIKDTLSANVNAGSVVVGASSAPYTYQLSGAGILTFTFEGINLPDSSHGMSSEGFVTYTVHTRGNLSEGAPISNTAYIYFDLNPAVVTNTTHNTRSDFPNGIPAISGDAMSAQVIPNPAHDRATILFAGGVGAIMLHVTDALGHTITDAVITGASYTLDAEALASGVYFYTADDSRRHTTSGKISVVH